MGAVTSACLAASGHSVIAVDTNARKVDCIAHGRTPIVETGLDTLIAEHTRAGTLRATQDSVFAIRESDISLICVGTPSRADGGLDLSCVKSVCRDIGKALRDKDGFHTIVLRSTMLPGSAEKACLPVLEEASGKKAGTDFGLGCNPEFLREGTAVQDYYNPPKIVIGAADKQTADAILSLYDGIEALRVVADIPVAEGVKYAANAWHAMKIGFANEMGNVLKACGVDSHKVMDIFCKDTKLNISPAYLRPGFAFGGSCLPKDVRAIRAAGRNTGIETPLFDALLEANTRQVRRAADMIASTGRRNVGLFGLAFKPGTDDIRESPLAALAMHLLNADYRVRIYDPHVRETEEPLHTCLSDTAEDVAAQADIFVLGHSHPDFVRVIQSAANTNTPLIDLARADPELECREGYHGICW